MRHLSNKIAAAKSTVIAHYKIGDDCFSISEKNGLYCGTYNGYEILSYDGRYRDKAANVFGSVIAFLSDREDKKIQQIRKKQANSFVQEVNAYLKNSTKKIAVEEGEVKIEVPEFDVGEAVNQKDLITNLYKFQDMLKGTVGLLSSIQEQALSLTDSRIVSTMWGAQQMQQLLDRIRDDVKCEDLWNKLDFYVEMISRSIERLIIKLNTELCKVCQEEKRIVGTVLIPNIVSNYESLMGVMARVLAVLEPLININDKFKKETSYPASWFLKGTMLEDMKEDFNKLLETVLRTPEIEKQILFPLDVLKTQFISVK